MFVFLLLLTTDTKDKLTLLNETLTADTCDEGPTQADLYNCHRRKFALGSHLRNLMMLLKRGMVIGYLTFISWRPPQIHLHTYIHTYFGRLLYNFAPRKVNDRSPVFNLQIGRSNSPLPLVFLP